MVKIDKIEVPTEKKEFVNANIIEVEVGTTGYKGGDSGHGGRTFFRIEDKACTDMQITFRAENMFGGGWETGTGNYKNKIHGWGLECSSVELVFGGDAELETFIQALEFAVETLKKQVNSAR